jgi:predicted aldo/keto reductase-like oxidoreductase
MGSRKSDLTRRQFLATSLTGLAAKEAEEGKGSKAKMIYRTLGKTGINLPIVSMGAMNADNPEIVQASYEAGVRHFDTASLYAFGRNEQMLGKVIKELGVRDKVVIGTKERVAQIGDRSAAEIKEKFIKLTEGSLKRLKTDYIDIVSIHSVQSAADLDNGALFEAMDQLKKDGKARASGISTHQNMTEIITRVTDEELCDTVLTSFNVSMADDKELIEAIDKAAAKGIGILAMKTQAGGRQLPNQASLTKYDNAIVNTAMLKWAMRHESITTAIPGYTNFEHMKQDLSVVFGLEYTEDEKRFLADNELQVGLGFCRQCQQCLATCPHRVDVPTLMRTHMYAAQYSNFRQARATLDGIPSGRSISACTSCDVCTAECANAVDIAYRIEELKQIYG